MTRGTGCYGDVTLSVRPLLDGAQSRGTSPACLKGQTDFADTRIDRRLPQVANRGVTQEAVQDRRPPQAPSSGSRTSRSISARKKRTCRPRLDTPQDAGPTPVQNRGNRNRQQGSDLAGLHDVLAGQSPWGIVGVNPIHGSATEPQVASVRACRPRSHRPQQAWPAGVRAKRSSNAVSRGSRPGAERGALRVLVAGR